jgi:hypothetical protein
MAVSSVHSHLLEVFYAGAGGDVGRNNIWSSCVIYDGCAASWRQISVAVEHH